MAIQEELSGESKSYMRVFKMIIRLFWAVMAFVYIEGTGLGDNFVEKNLIVMRLLLVFTVITFLIIILTLILESPPPELVECVIILAGTCAICVLMTAMISSITPVIVSIISIIALSAIAIFKHEPTTCVSGLKRFKYTTDMIFRLFYALILFVGGEITNFFGDKVEKYPFAMRLLLLLIVIFLLFGIIATVLLEDPPVYCLVQTMVLMVVSCVVCVLLVLLVSNVTAVLVSVSWMVGILIVVVQRWNDLVQQMKDIKNVVENKF